MEVVINYESLPGANNEPVVKELAIAAKVWYIRIISKPRTICNLTGPTKTVRIGVMVA
jgi:hypothetical protein